MVEIGKLTGEYDATGYIGVRLSHGEVLFARPLMQVPTIASYTKEWVDAYGGNFLAVVAYENDMHERPILMGVIPLKNPSFPEEGFENNYFFTTPKFRLHVDDNANKITIDTLETNAQILLGNKDVTESAMLGDKWKAWAKKLVAEIGKIKVIAPSGLTSEPINKAAIDLLKEDLELDPILSKTVKLKD